MLEHIHYVARLRSGHKGFKAIEPEVGMAKIPAPRDESQAVPALCLGGQGLTVQKGFGVLLGIPQCHVQQLCIGHGRSEPCVPL